MDDALKWENGTRTLGDLLGNEWERNPRLITQQDAERLIKSEETFGQVETIAVGPDNEVYNGHQRLKVWAQEKGPEFVVDVRFANRALTETERERLTVYLHQGATGDWDWDALATWNMDDLLEWGFESGDFPSEGEEGTTPEIKIEDTYFVFVELENEESQALLIDRLTEEGYVCKASL